MRSTPHAPHVPRYSDVEYHSAEAKRYLNFWTSPQAEVSPEEAAFYFLGHTRMVHRYTDDREVLVSLTSLPHDKRKQLVTAACRFLAAANYANTAHEIVTKDDAFDDETFERAEEFLLMRDFICAVVEAVMVIGKDILDTPGNAREALLLALNQESRLDNVLQQDLPIFAPAQERMKQLAAKVKTPIDPNRHWWLDNLGDRIKQAKEEPGIAEVLLTTSPFRTTSQV